MTNYAYDGGRPTVGQAAAQQVGLEEQLSRLDKLELVIAAERERLNRPSADSRDQPGARSGDQYDPRSGDQQEPVREVSEGEGVVEDAGADLQQEMRTASTKVRQVR